jgi:hypothetical protein
MNLPTPRPECAGLYKPVLLPEALEFSELFDVIGEEEWSVPLNPGEKDTALIYHWCRLPEYKSVHVRPKDEVIDTLRQTLIDTGERDRIHFECIAHDNGYALITAQYNLIIGSRYLAYIKVDSLPEVPND